jgi:hypothetical protein
MPSRTEIHLYEAISFTLPYQPPRNQIAGHDLPKKKQKFQRTELPDKFYGLNKTQTEELCKTDREAMDFVLEEDRRCTEGYWFYNCGEATYITGDHYFYLNYFKIDNGLPRYRDADRRWFYFWQVCKTDPDSAGMLYAKKRRDGFSLRAISCKLNKARRTFNSMFMLISKTGKDAKSLFDKLVYAFKNLPEFFKPLVPTKEDPKKILEFNASTQYFSAKSKNIEKIVSLNTKMYWENTTENAGDGEKVDVVADEISKWEEADFNVWLAIVVKSATVGRNIVRKLICGSSPNNQDEAITDAKKKHMGGRAFVEPWKASNTFERDLNGRTASKLYRYFCTAADGYEGFIDEYGRSVIDDPPEPVMGEDGNLITMGAKRWIKNNLDFLKQQGHATLYSEARRMDPLTEADLFFNGGSDDNAFNLQKLEEQIAHNTEFYAANPHLLQRGNFAWERGVRDSRVIWIPDERGRFLVSWLPDEADRNQTISRWGMKWPANYQTGVFGVDPFDYAKRSTNKKSDGTMYGLLKYDPAAPYPTNCFILEYVNRPADINIFFEDMLMCCVFYGWQMNIERNKSSLIQYVKNRGYTAYLFVAASNQPEYMEKLRDGDFGMATTGDITSPFKSRFVECTQAYIENNIGIHNDTNKMGYCPFNTLLQSWSDFVPHERWTEFDSVVGAGFALLGCNTFTPAKVQRERRSMELFTRFSIQGNDSVPIQTGKDAMMFSNTSDFCQDCKAIYYNCICNQK